MSAAAAAAKEELFARVRAALADSTAEPIRSAWFVPGRIEVLGKHTDYAGGRSLLAAVERGVCAVAAPRDDHRVTVTDVGRRTSITVALDPELTAAASGWGNYVATVARRMARNFPRARTGADIALASDLPSSSGMSSSSALITTLFLLLADINALQDHDGAAAVLTRREDLAAYLATVENGQRFGALDGDRGVGTTGGSEDHTAILCCRGGVLSQYAFCPVRLERSIDLEPGLVFAIGVSGVSASKTGSARERYNEAAAATRRMLDLWHSATGRAHAVLGDVLASDADAAGRLREIIRDNEDESRARTLGDRLDQFIEESERLVPAAALSLAEQDYAAFGTLADRSQALAERSLGNQITETIALARSARRHGAIAASAFGAGFGGSVWALVAAGDASTFVDRWAASYQQAFPDAATQSKFFLTRPGPAALLID
jgi:galactokinase